MMWRRNNWGRGWGSTRAGLCAFMQHLLCARHCIGLDPHQSLPATGEEHTQRGEGTCPRSQSQEGVGSDGLPLGGCPNGQQAPHEITSPHIYLEATETGYQEAGDTQLVCSPRSYKELALSQRPLGSSGILPGAET